MIQNLEITTMDLEKQEYAHLKIHPNEKDYTIKYPGFDFPLESSLVEETYKAFRETGLYRAIKRDMRTINQSPEPESIRLIHEISHPKEKPILRISPIGEERICVTNYFLECLDSPLQFISSSGEFGGCLILEYGKFFNGLTVFLTMSDQEEHHKHYFGRNLKETRRLH